MMPFTEKWNKAFRCGAASLGPRWASSKVFCVNRCSRSLEEIATACRALQETDVLPWPDHQCVIVVEGVPTPDSTLLVAREGSTDAALVCWVVPGPRIIRRYHAHFRRERLVLDSVERFRRVITSELRKAVIGNVTGGSDEVFLKDRVEDYLAVFGITGTMKTPVSTVWMEDQRGPLSGFPLMYALANMATACDYRVTQRLGRGYGTSSMRRKTVGQELLHIVNYERLYREVEVVNPEGVQDVRPHSRRGHWRFRWQEKGIDRRTDLPKRAIHRLALALRRGVRRIYVNPCWVGVRKWLKGDDEFEIHGGQEPA